MVAAQEPAESGHFHDGEIIGDFAAVGALASIDLLARQNISNGNEVTFILLAGLAGGGGAGYLLTQKFSNDTGSAHATTVGLLLGAANGALLIEPANYDHASSVLGLMLLGSAVGAAGGFAYGQITHLTPGQAMFVGNLILLGSATAALGAITANRDGHFGGFEDGTLALGLDGGAVAGALIAPALDWSPHRAKVVFAYTLVGAMVGSLVAGLIAKPDTNADADTNIVTAAMTAGLWGGFGLGILTTKDAAPDARFAQPTSTSTPITLLPYVGDRSQLGVMAGGTF